MWTGYTTRQAAELIGLPESAIRGCVRAGVLGPAETAPLRLDFRDIKILSVVKSLTGDGISLRRVRRELALLRARLNDGQSLAELPLEATGGHIIVRDARRAWRADNGQLLLGFDLEPPTGLLAELPVRREAEGPEAIDPLTAEEWFERGIELEDTDTAAAIRAYRRALTLRPACSETWINLGRLHAETGNSSGAAECFEEALRLDPGDATALYNLGVVAQDEARDDDAVDYYRRALDLDPALAEAHYNLATIFDRSGDPRAAIRHINEYRKLTRRS